MFTVLMIHVANAGLRLEEVLIDYYSEHGAHLVSKEQENGLLKTELKQRGTLRPKNILEDGD